MHKKVQSLVLAGMISANTLTPVGQIFANEIKLENVLTPVGGEITAVPETGENIVGDTEIEILEGEGSKVKPFHLKANNIEGLNKIIAWLDNTEINTDYYRLKDVIDNTDNTKTYQLHVFGKDNLVTYLNITVDNNKADLINELDKIKVLIPIAGTGEGNGTKETPHEIQVNTEGGLTQLINWSYEQGYKFYKTGTVAEENNNKIYEVCAIPENNETVKSSNNQIIYMSLVVNNTNSEVIDYLETDVEVAPETTPENDGWQRFKTVADLDGYWTYTIEDNRVVVLKGYVGADKNTKVEIPRELDGMPVELEGFGGKFSGITHFRVAEGNGNKVKLRANNLDGWAAFYDNKNVEYLDFSGLDATIINLDQSFRACHNLKYLNLSGWDVTNTDTFMAMIYDCRSLEYLNLSGWNIKDSSDTGSFKGGVPALKTAIFRDTNSTTYNKIKPPIAQDGTLDVTNLNIKEGASLEGMFNGVKASEIIGLDTWKNTQNIIDMKRMFQGCSNLTTIEGVKDWDTSNVQHMGDMFDGCSSLTDFSPIYNWNTENVTAMNGMFINCSNVEELDLSNWKTDKVTNFNGTFRGCSKLKSIKGIEKWNTSSVTSMNNTFRNCLKLNFIDLSNWTTRSNTQMNDTFMLDGNVANEQRKLLVVTNDERLTKYNYASNNRSKVQTIFDAVDGEFHTVDGDKITRMIKERYVVTPEIANDIATEMEEARQFAGVPVKEGHIFGDWTTSKDLVGASIFDILDTTFTPIWGEITADPETGGTAVGDAPIDILDGEGSSTKPFVLKVNTLVGLEQTLKTIVDSGSGVALSRLGEVVDNGSEVTYKLHIVDGVYGYYVDIKVDKTKTELTDLLDRIDVTVEEETPVPTPPAEDGDNSTEGEGTPEQPPVVNPDENPSDKPEEVPPTTPEQPDSGVTPEEPSNPGDGEVKPNPPVEDETPDSGGEQQPPAGDNDTNGDQGSNGDDSNTGDGSTDTVPPTTPEQPETKPEVKPEDPSVPETPEQGTPEFKHDVVELVGGKGQIDNEYELVVKEVEKEVFNNFLQELKKVNTEVISVTKEGNYTLYKVKFDRMSRNTDNSVYAIIKVENEKTELVSAFNDFAVETNSTIVLPGQGSSDNTDTNVKPETDTNTGTEGVVDNNTNNNTNSGNNTSTNNSSTDNPKTRDVGVAGYATLGLASILGIFKNRRKRK